MAKKFKILVSGSITVDRLFDIRGDIKDYIHIKNGELGTQNLMFTAYENSEYFGGTGGNIAYGLGLLGENPLLFSVVGKDFDKPFKKHFTDLGVELRVYADQKRLSATFSAMSDDAKQQVGIFQPNAYGKHIENISLSDTLSSKDLTPIKIAIFAPGTAKSIISHMAEFQKHKKDGAISIFDPGQILMATFTKELLKKALSLSDILIANETEIHQIKTHFGLSFEEIFNLGVTYIIETLGENGSVLHMQNKRIKVAAVKAKKVVDPTGAGDAYRAGLISGLASGKTMEESMKIGAKLGAQCVAHKGGQTYSLPKSIAE